MHRRTTVRTVIASAMVSALCLLWAAPAGADHDDGPVYPGTMGPTGVTGCDPMADGLRPLRSVPAPGQTSTVTTSRDGSLLYVSHSGSLFSGGEKVTVHEAQTLTEVASIPIAGGVPTYPGKVVLNPAGTKGYITTSGELVVFEVATNKVISRIEVAADMRDGIVFNRAGTKAYSSHYNGSVTVLDTVSDTVLDEIKLNSIEVSDGQSVGTFGGMALDPTEKFAYVGGITWPGNVYVIDLAAKRIIDVLPAGRNVNRVSVSPDGATLYAVNGGGRVTVTDIPTRTIKATIPVASYINEIVFSPNGKRAFVPVPVENRIAIIDLSINANICSARLLPKYVNSPAGIALSPDGRTMYTADYISDKLSAFDVPAERNTAFRDVPASSMFHREITWLAAGGTSTGYNDGTYRPLQTVRRDAMAAFLYRLAGSPVFEPPTASPFSDVASTSQFYKEITWLAHREIATGWDDGTYRPLEPVNRDAMAAFIFRYVDDRHFVPTESPFSDIEPDTAFYWEMAWMARSGISTGWDDGTYRPLQPVNRDAMAAFLFRLNERVLR